MEKGVLLYFPFLFKWAGDLIVLDDSYGSIEGFVG